MSTSYKKIGKHQKKCAVCGKLIQEGEMVDFQKVVKEKYYPIKGIMKFTNWLITHSTCSRKDE